MADNPLVVTFAARYSMDLPDIREDAVRLLSGDVRMVPPPAVKAANPDTWNAVLQVAFEYVGDLGIGLIGAWLYDRLKDVKDADLEPHVLVDQSVHIHNRTFINNIEVTGTASREDIERIVRDVLAEGSAPPDVPPQLAEPFEARDKPEDMSDEDWWFKQQVERGRVHGEEIERFQRRSR